MEAYNSQLKLGKMIHKSTLRMELTLSLGFQWDEKIHKHSEALWILVDMLMIGGSLKVKIDTLAPKNKAQHFFVSKACLLMLGKFINIFVVMNEL